MADGFPLREEAYWPQAMPLARMSSTDQEGTSVMQVACVMTALAGDTAGAVLPTDQLQQ